MIIQPGSDEDTQNKYTQRQSTAASGSNPPPPPFSANDPLCPNVNETTPLAHHSLVDLGSPPEFAPYQAENFEQNNHDVVSHDAHLNSDGEALYRFLLSQSELRPSYRVQCRGTHNEMQSRWVTERDSHGHSRSRREAYPETVVDFDFCIDILPEVTEGQNPITWSVSDDEPAYRGKMVREYEGSSPRILSADSTRHKVTRSEVKKHKSWATHRSRLGLPPWIRQEYMECDPADTLAFSSTDGLKSSKSIRQWADEYCASPKHLKEFVYEKVLYGWNIEQLESAIRATIESVPYNGSLAVDITPLGSKVYIRSDNRVSRMLSNKWLKFLSIILLIFPFIWLFKRFHSRGGGRWEVCGGAYPIKQWVPLEPGEEMPLELDAESAVEALPAYNSIAAGSRSRSTRVGSKRYMQTPTGPKKLVGLREGEWFRTWEHAIKRAVIGRYKSQTPLPPGTRSLSEAELLDGYNESPPLIEY